MEGDASPAQPRHFTLDKLSLSVLTSVLRYITRVDLYLHLQIHGYGHADSATEITSPLDTAFATLVNQTLKDWHVPGMSIAVVHGAQTWAKGYGYANVHSQEAVTPHTLFYIGSNTKAFTAATIALLIDDPTKQIQLDTPISSLIPDDFVLSDSYATSHTTLIDALSHRVGLASFDPLYFDTNTSVKDVTRKLRYLNFVKEFRAGFTYCNLMYTALSHVIETMTNMTLSDFMARRLWNPLNMTATYFSLADAQRSTFPIAKAYIWSEKNQAYQQRKYLNLPSISGAGAIISNVLDCAHWVRMMVNREGPLSPASHEALTTPYSIVGPAISSFASTNLYGLGWDVATYHGTKVVWHQGGTSSFGSYILFLPGKRWGVVAFGNTAETSNCAEERLVWYLVDEFLGIPAAQRFVSRTECGR
ncbi:MAG: hypothetical protein L6R38_003890 [Xanthoria sp. 2 TBL-2021]|nr:MAG: hypothetical protein L6R38_003890 [Xanthoria sp. 2 TBL-2021]